MAGRSCCLLLLLQQVGISNMLSHALRNHDDSSTAGIPE
jgi:hypothetical protein